MNKIIYIILINLILLNTVFNQQNKPKVADSKKQALIQAKSLEKSGLIKEATNIYLQLLNNKMYIDEAFIALKNIYINDKDYDALTNITDQYLNLNSNNKLINVLDVYIINDDINNLDRTINQILIKQKNDKGIINNMITKLLDYNKDEKAKEIITKIRNKDNKSFYCLQLGMYYAINNKINEALNEYLLYLSINKKNINIISNRIISLSDDQGNVPIIKRKLSDSNLIESKLILSELEFKLKNYKESYELIKLYANDDTKKMFFVQQLIKEDNLEFAQIVINEIIKTSNNNDIIQKAIFTLAQIFEIKLNSNPQKMPISSIINNNTLLKSPFIKLNSEYSDLLNNTINIYDSLSLNFNDIKSKYHLAEIRYRILGDLDRANILYQDIYKKSRNNKYKNLALKRLIDVQLSSGNLDEAETLINKKYSSANNELKNELEIKKIQISFYKGDRKSTINKCREILSTLSKDNTQYNDILDILSLTYSFKDENVFKEYANAKFKIIQNKRMQAINILIDLNVKHNIDKVKYELLYLNTLQGNFNNVLSSIENLKNNFTYMENATILKGEIYDYILNKKSDAVDTYLNYLDDFPNSIYYDMTRKRLRKIAL
tara:strand:- start:4499 stop:6316 length:1818 start_codon:yes stop_codon:yes gene_type:complete